MRVHSIGAGMLATATALLAAAVVRPPAVAAQDPSPAQMQGKTAGQYFKNIKVLNNVPADQLIEDMEYISIALGTRCDTCHDGRDFASDAKQPKATAREMMQMLFTIDKDNFNGRTEVSCYTCHQGRLQPSGMPAPAAAESAAPAAVMPQAQPIQPAPGTPVPTLDEVLAKYADALGGQAALAQVNSRVLEVENTSLGENRPPMPEQVYEAAPNKLLIVARFGQREFRTGYNGAEAWQGSSEGARKLAGMAALLPPREDPLNPLAALDAYQGKRLVAIVRIAGREAYVVTARAPDGLPERFFFDTQTGLLIRRAMLYRTIFGPLLYQADYSDYRKQDGVVIPFQTAWWAGGMSWTQTVKSVKTNVPVDNAEFEPPAAPAQASPSGPR